MRTSSIKHLFCRLIKATPCCLVALLPCCLVALLPCCFREKSTSPYLYIFFYPFQFFFFFFHRFIFSPCLSNLVSNSCRLLFISLAFVLLFFVVVQSRSHLFVFLLTWQNIWEIAFCVESSPSVFFAPRVEHFIKLLSSFCVLWDSLIPFLSRWPLQTGVELSTLMPCHTDTLHVNDLTDPSLVTLIISSWSGPNVFGQIHNFMWLLWFHWLTLSLYFHFY